MRWKCWCEAGAYGAVGGKKLGCDKCEDLDHLGSGQLTPARRKSEVQRNIHDGFNGQVKPRAGFQARRVKR